MAQANPTPPKLKTKRDCTVCSEPFYATTRAVRCNTCKKTGRAVSSEPKAPRQPKVKPKFTHECVVCEETFEGTRRAKRCQACKDAGLKQPVEYVPQRTCVSCKQTFNVEQHDHIQCASCAEALDVERSELTPEQEADVRAENRKARWLKELASQNAYLDRRAMKPKGQKAMNPVTATLPIGVLWLEIVGRDGSASTVISCKSDVSYEDREKLVMSYTRLRMKGFHPDAIAKLCPVALLKGATQAAIKDLPKVTESEPEDPWSFDPLEDLSPELRADVEQFMHVQAAKAEALQLGLT